MSAASGLIRPVVAWMALGLATVAEPVGAQSAPSPSIGFNRDIRPLLSIYCFECHGPDSAARQADLRLDQAESAYADRGGYRVIDPEQPDHSELLRRLFTDDTDRRMPPVDSPRQPRREELQRLAAWVQAGGPYEAHWSLIPPRDVAPPDSVPAPEWFPLTSPIDTFVARRLQDAGLRPAPPASRETLIRRITLDLTGLPPTPAEIDAFLNDMRPDAWSRVVDRLLASPRYGERMAQVWLDAARFADSGGYQGDILRDMTRWRDWVIQAFSDNLPFHQFTIEQLAGDLLDAPETSQLVATGFHRNHRINDEDGIIFEEFRVEYVADRVETTATVWLGLTARCARCHDHKYDALTQREYYGLFAFFNSIDELGRGRGNAPPLLRFIPPAVQKQIDAIDRQLAQAAGREAATPPSGGAPPDPAATDGDSSEAELPDTAELRQQRDRLLKSVPSTMIMRELEEPRPTHVLIRGAYDRPGDLVQPGTPAAVAPEFRGFPANRLGLAQWLVDPRNPLTARVAVNRYWQMYFGKGLVETAEDFGTQGQLPSHPDLLDWLAREFIRSGWNVKALQRLIVHSSTYRQTSQVSRAHWQRDPANRLLSRGPRFRLTAEAIRDQALAASGLLNEQIGGRSVRPYQPEGLWVELASASQQYNQERGAQLYRRSLYTFIRRTVPPPAMTTLDAPDRELCTVRRTTTNTPLQALVLMNDETWVEAARALAERCIREVPAAGDHESLTACRIDRAFRLVLARRPTNPERAPLNEALAYYLDRFRSAPADAARLISVGDSSPDPAIDAAELAAWTAICSLILNLDETVTRE